MWGISLVAASGGHSSSRCVGPSLSRPLLLWSTGSRHSGSAVVAHGPSCSAACGVFPDQGSNPCPLYWQADSQPLHHQGSPSVFLNLFLYLSPAPLSFKHRNMLFFCSVALDLYLVLSSYRNNNISNLLKAYYMLDPVFNTWHLYYFIYSLKDFYEWGIIILIFQTMNLSFSELKPCNFQGHEYK